MNHVSSIFHMSPAAFAGTLRMISGALGSTAFFLQPYEATMETSFENM